MAIRFHNTLTKQKEEFKPVEPGKVKFYMCGPTVYDYIHIGNARAFVVFDVLRRFLAYRGFEVTYVMNLTDIDDKIIDRAKREHTSTTEITETYTQAFFEDLEALGVGPADYHPRATEHVHDMIALIEKLVEKGVAYQSNGDVFYDVSKFPHYGRLSGKNPDDLKAGSRVAVDEKKRNPLDFVLWKSQKPGEPAWDSPWGPGRPGWHIECSTMSMHYLGESFDIHAGGEDLIFPHHENEIAQSEGATGKPFVRYWLHNGFLKIEGDKMAKSLGNFRTAREVLQQYPREVIRMFFLQKHYRSPIDFTPAGLQAAKSAVERLRLFYEKLVQATPDYAAEEVDKRKASLGEAARDWLARHEKLKAALVAGMEDDLNTPVALSRLFDMVRETNKLLNKPELTPDERNLLKIVRKDIEDFNSFLGVVMAATESGGSEITEALIELLVQVRSELRKKKEWQLADRIRDELDKLDVVLEDKGEETTWRWR